MFLDTRTIPIHGNNGYRWFSTRHSNAPEDARGWCALQNRSNREHEFAVNFRAFWELRLTVWCQANYSIALGCGIFALHSSETWKYTLHLSARIGPRVQVFIIWNGTFWREGVGLGDFCSPHFGRELSLLLEIIWVTELWWTMQDFVLPLSVSPVLNMKHVETVWFW